VNATTGAPACAANAFLSATPFNATSLNPTGAGTQLAFNYPAAWTAPTSATADIGNLIAWTRGTDNLANEAGPGSLTTVRPSVHGDVVHSRPVVINYGGTPPRVVVFYGSNNGMLRAIEGKQTGTGAGNELWSFVVPETLGKLNRLREQTPKVVVPSNPVSGRTTRTTSWMGASAPIRKARRRSSTRLRDEAAISSTRSMSAIPTHPGSSSSSPPARRA
jgi:type IV pilus assembly protein PilY1